MDTYLQKLYTTIIQGSSLLSSSRNSWCFLEL